MTTIWTRSPRSSRNAKQLKHRTALPPSSLVELSWITSWMSQEASLITTLVSLRRIGIRLKSPSLKFLSIQAELTSCTKPYTLTIVSRCQNLRCPPLLSALGTRPTTWRIIQDSITTSSMKTIHSLSWLVNSMAEMETRCNRCG